MCVADLNIWESHSLKSFVNARQFKSLLLNTDPIAVCLKKKKFICLLTWLGNLLITFCDDNNKNYSTLFQIFFFFEIHLSTEMCFLFCLTFVIWWKELNRWKFKLFLNFLLLFFKLVYHKWLTTMSCTIR